MITVFLTDDHPAYRAGVRVILERNDDIVIIGEAESGTDAIRGVLERPPDVLLLDMELPDMSGLDVTRELMKHGLETRILPLSGFDDPEYVLGCLDAGSAGYLTKDTPSNLIVQAVRSVARGGVYVSPQTAFDIVTERRRLAQDVERVRETCEDLIRRGISLRLFQILKMVAEGLSNDDIADREYRSERTIRNQVQEIKNALDLQFRPALVAWVWRHGIHEIDDSVFERIQAREI